MVAIEPYWKAKRGTDRRVIFEPFKHTDGVVRVRDRAVWQLFKKNKLKQPHDATWARWCSKDEGGEFPPSAAKSSTG